MGWAGLVCGTMAVVGSVYALAAALAIRRFSRQRSPTALAFPGVTILKPLHGTEENLHDNLASFCRQTYAGPVQILFGVDDPRDPAAGVVRHLLTAFPERDFELVAGPHASAPNPKIANLRGMHRHTRHDIVVIADSDIAVQPDYLARVVAALEQPGVGAVTCLYRGARCDGLWARLASMAIDYDFLPNVVVGLRLGLARPCFGSTIALRRETLRAIGGFESFVNHLADDNAIGESVRAIGLRVEVPALVLEHGCPEQSGSAMLGHEVRWARTVRAVSPAGYAGLVLTYPIPFAVLAACATGFGAIGSSLLALAMASRLILQVQVDRALPVRPTRWPLGPLRDLLSFCVYIAGFLVSVVTWRGDRYRVHADGTLIPLGNPKS